MSERFEINDIPYGWHWDNVSGRFVPDKNPNDPEVVRRETMKTVHLPEEDT